MSLLLFLKMPKIWVGRTTLNGEKTEDGPMKFKQCNFHKKDRTKPKSNFRGG